MLFLTLYGKESIFFLLFAQKTANLQRISEKVIELLKVKIPFTQAFLVKKEEYRQANLFFIGKRAGNQPFNFCDRSRYLL